MLSLRCLTPEDYLRQLWIDRWGGEEMITRETVYRPGQLDNLVVEDGDEWIGLLTFFVSMTDVLKTPLSH